MMRPATAADVATIEAIVLKISKVFERRIEVIFEAPNN